jgi:SAM-dependent methyltransferase
MAESTDPVSSPVVLVNPLDGYSVPDPLYVWSEWGFQGALWINLDMFISLLFGWGGGLRESAMQVVIKGLMIRTDVEPNSFTKRCRKRFARIVETVPSPAYNCIGYWLGVDSHSRACQNMHNLVVSKCLLRRPGVCVVAGCGNGLELLSLSELGICSLVGLEVDKIMLSMARHAISGEDPKKVIVRRDDASELASIADGSADSVVSIDSVFQFRSRAKFLGNAFRSLKNGGVLMFTDIAFMKEGIHTTLVRRMLGIPKCNYMTPGRLETDLRLAGFGNLEITDITQESLIPLANHLAATESGLLASLGMFNRLRRSLISSGARHLMVVATKPPV